METTTEITVMMAMTIATIRRSTKNLATRSAAGRVKAWGDEVLPSCGRRRAAILARADASVCDLQGADAIPDLIDSHRPPGCSRRAP